MAGVQPGGDGLQGSLQFGVGLEFGRVVAEGGDDGLDHVGLEVLLRGDGSSELGERLIDDQALSLTGDARAMTATGLTARVHEEHADGSLVLAITSSSLAQLVRIGSAAYRASDSYFTLVEGVERLIHLVPTDLEADPSMLVEALNDAQPVRLRHVRVRAGDHRLPHLSSDGGEHANAGSAC